MQAEQSSTQTSLLQKEVIRLQWGVEDAGQPQGLDMSALQEVTRPSQASRV